MISARDGKGRLVDVCGEVEAELMLGGEEGSDLSDSPDTRGVGDAVFATLGDCGGELGSVLGGARDRALTLPASDPTLACAGPEEMLLFALEGAFSKAMYSAYVISFQPLMECTTWAAEVDRQVSGAQDAGWCWVMETNNLAPALWMLHFDGYDEGTQG